MMPIKREIVWDVSSEERGASSELCKDQQSSKHRGNSDGSNSNADLQQQEQIAMQQHDDDDVKPVITRSRARRLSTSSPPQLPPAAAAAAAGMAEADIAQDLCAQPSSDLAEATQQLHQQQVDNALAVTEHTPDRPSRKRRQGSDAAAAEGAAAAAGGESDDVIDDEDGPSKYLWFHRTPSASPESDHRRHQQQEEEEQDLQDDEDEDDQGSELQHLPQGDDLLQQQQPNMAGVDPVTNDDGGASSKPPAHQQDFPGRQVAVQIVVGRCFVLNEKNIKNGLSISRSLVRLQFGQPKQLVPVNLKVVVNDQPVVPRVPQPQVKVSCYKGPRSINCLVFGGHHAGLMDYIGYRIDKWKCSNASELTMYLQGPVESDTAHESAAAAEAGEAVSADGQLQQQQQAVDHMMGHPAAAKRRRYSSSTNGVGAGGTPCTYASSSLVLSEGNLKSGLCISKFLVEAQFPSVPVLVKLQVMLNGEKTDLSPHGGAVRIVRFQNNCYLVQHAHKLGLLQCIGHRLIGYSCTDGGTLVMHLQTPSTTAEGTAHLAAAAAAATAGGGGGGGEKRPSRQITAAAAAAAATGDSAWLYGTADAATAAEDAIAESSWWEHVHMHTRNGTILQQRHKSEIRVSLRLFQKAFGSQNYAGRKMMMSVWRDGVRIGGPLVCKMHNSACSVNPPTSLITSVLGCTLHKLRAARPHFLQVHVSSPPTDYPAAATAATDVDAADPAKDNDVQHAAADSDCRSDSDILPTVAAAADAADIDTASDGQLQKLANGSDGRLKPNWLVRASAARAPRSMPAAGMAVAAAAAAAATQAADAAEAPVPPAPAATAAALAGGDLTPCSHQQQQQIEPRRQHRFTLLGPKAIAAIEAEQTSASRLTAEAAARLHQFMTSQLQQQQRQERQDQLKITSNGQASGAATSAAAPAAAAVVIGGQCAAVSGGTGTGTQGHPAAAATAELADRRSHKRRPFPAAAAAAWPAGSVTAQHIPVAAADSCPLPVGYKLPDFVTISDAEDHLCDLLSVDNLHCPDQQLDRLQETAATLMRLPAGHDKLLRFRKDYRYVQEWVRRRNVAKIVTAVDKMLDSAQEACS